MAYALLPTTTIEAINQGVCHTPLQPMRPYPVIFQSPLTDVRWMSPGINSRADAMTGMARENTIHPWTISSGLPFRQRPHFHPAVLDADLVGDGG
jgi:hypothetical protein